MTTTQTRQIVDTLTAWMSGTALVDDLIPRTEALLASLSTARKPARACHAIDTSAPPDDMDDPTQRAAWFKRTALREDVRFFLEHTTGVDLELRRRGSVLLSELSQRKATAADRKAYNALCQEWRQSRIPPAGDKPWPDLAGVTIYYDGELPTRCPCVIRKGKRPLTQVTRAAARKAAQRAYRQAVEESLREAVA